MHLPSDIGVCWVRHDPAEQERLERLLSEEERKRMAAYALDKRRREFVLGRAAARLLLAGRLEVQPEDVPLQVADDGAVDVLGAEMAVSIAHSGERAVAAAGKRRVGIDLERIVPRRADLRRFVLHPEEYEAYDALPLDPTRKMILVWTLKEATLKALRTGFRLSPKKLRLAVDVDRQEAVVQVENAVRFVTRFEEREEYMMAVAYEE